MRNLKNFVQWISMVCVLIAFVGIFYIDKQRRTQGECVADWANNYTAVATARSAASGDRLNALHKLLLDAIASPAQKQASGDQVNLIRALTTGDTEVIKAAAAVRLQNLLAANADPILTEDVKMFIETENAYQKSIKEHPLPEPPKEVCR